jgi:nicotinamide-nucleotide amidase
MNRAEIIAVGSELLTPYRLDTNSLYLTEELNRLGIAVVRKSVVADDRQALAAAFHEALERADLVVSTGGLGPTEDDLTREAAADALGRRLLLDESVLEKIRERFARLGRVMAPNNQRQAMVPEGAIILPNAAGTAPGIWIEAGERAVLLLPGPLGELRRIFAERARPLIERLAGERRMTHRMLRTVGLPESDVDHHAAPIYQSYADVETTILATHEGIEIHLTRWSEDQAESARVLDELAARIAATLGDAVFSTEGETLDTAIARELQQAGLTVAVAESCTGGIVSSRLTRIPGSSLFFLGGAVCYSNQMKTAWAGVPAELIERHGAVSSEVAIALAEGARRATGAALGLGLTGIAGPGGGTPEKPVGTVHIALAHEGGVREQLILYAGDRERIRRLAAQSALDILRRHLLRARRERG